MRRNSGCVSPGFAFGDPTENGERAVQSVSVRRRGGKGMRCTRDERGEEGAREEEEGQEGGKGRDKDRGNDNRGGEE
eukprot:3486130-Rhodomonas_salina.2